MVALKMLPREALGREDLQQRILREARAAALLNHAHVCSIYDVDDVLGFLVMEYIEGPTLKQRLAAGRPEREEVIRIAAQLADGLNAAHSLGIVHRDIKPSNVMLTSSGDVKITDFGLAKIGNQKTVTLAGQIVGTPAYMSPEQVRGEKLDAATDIWSFGVVLYEMLTGALPFGRGNITSTLYKIVHEPPLPLSQAAGDDHPEILSMIDRCLAKNRVDRYHSMNEIAAILGVLRAPHFGRPATNTQTDSTLTLPVGGAPSIAVLDFRNESGESELDWLATAIAETLTADIRKIPRLRVVDRQQVIRLARPTLGTIEARWQAVGVDLAARWLLYGSYERSQTNLKISANVVDSLGGMIVGHGEETGPLEQVLSMLDRVLAQAMQGFGFSPNEDEMGKMKRPETEVLEAYRLYARGRRLFYTFDPQKMEEARQTFESAIRLDSRYGLSWVGLGTIYAFRYIETTNTDDLDMGIGYLLQATAVDPELGEAHTSLAYAFLRHREFERGIRAASRAVELEPSSTAAHYFLAANHLGSAIEGRQLQHFRPAIHHFTESVRIEPNYQPGLMMLGWVLMLRGHLEAAAEYLKRSADVERTGSFDVIQTVGAQTLLGYAQYRLGQLSDAMQSFRHSLEYLRTNSHLYANFFIAHTHCALADIELERGLRDKAIEQVRAALKSIEENRKGLGIGYCMVRALAGSARAFQKLGMARESRENLDRAVELYETKADYDFHFGWEACDAQACYDLARASAVVDRHEQAVRWLEKSVQAGWRDREFLMRDEALSSVVGATPFDVMLLAAGALSISDD